MTTLPKAELHLHLEGTLEPATIFRFAERNRVALPYRDVDDLAARYQYSDLQSFLDLYYANMATLRTPHDFADMTDAYLARAAVAGVRHAEVFLDPQAHTARGIALEDVLDGVTSALNTSLPRYGISTGLIITMLRDLSAESAMRRSTTSSGSGNPSSASAWTPPRSATHPRSSAASSPGPRRGPAHRRPRR